MSTSRLLIFWALICVPFYLLPPINPLTEEEIEKRMKAFKLPMKRDIFGGQLPAIIMRTLP